MTELETFDQLRDVFIIVTIFCISLALLFTFFKPKEKSTYVSSSTSNSKKKSATKKKRKSKESKIPNVSSSDLHEKDSSGEEVENIPPEIPDKNRRKSIELELVPELLEDQITEKHEPHLNQNPSRPILKNRNFVENVDLNSFGIHYDHKITPRDEVEIFHMKTHHSDAGICYKTDPGLVEQAESPWDTPFADQDSSDSLDKVPNKNKNRKRKRKSQLDANVTETQNEFRVEVHSQTEPSEDFKQAQSQVNELNSKLNKTTKELKVATDELATYRKKNSLLEKDNRDLRSREEDVSRTCQALQQELNDSISRFRNSEKNKEGAIIRLKAAETEVQNSQQEKTLAMQENQKLRQSISHLNGKLSLINNISNENLSLKNRLEQTEAELKCLKQASLMCKNSFAEKENKWKSEMSESSHRISNIENRLQHCLHELDIKERRCEEYVKEISQLSDERRTQSRTIEGLREQFQALSQKQLMMDREKNDSEARYRSGLNEMRGQISSLNRQLSDANAETDRLRVALDESKTEQMVLVNVSESGRVSGSSSDRDVMLVDNGVSSEQFAALENELKQKEQAWKARESALDSEAQSLKREAQLLNSVLKTKANSLARVQEEKRQIISECDKYKEALSFAEAALDSLQPLIERTSIHSNSTSNDEYPTNQKTNQSQKQITEIKTNNVEVNRKSKKTKNKQPKINGTTQHNDTLEEGEIRDNLSFLDD